MQVFRTLILFDCMERSRTGSEVDSGERFDFDCLAWGGRGGFEDSVVILHF